MILVRSGTRKKTKNEDLSGIKIKSKDSVQLQIAASKALGHNSQNLKRIDENTSQHEYLEENSFNNESKKKHKNSAPKTITI